MSRKWIDISVPLRSGMVHWPGDTPVKIARDRAIELGDHCNLSNLSLSAHAGTHMDAPLHFIHNGRSLDQMPVDAAIGPARVLEIKDRQSIKPDELMRFRIKRGERLLFKTRNSRNGWADQEFQKEFVHISKEAAQYLAERRVRVVGIDYLSVGGFKKDGTETHLFLLGAGIWIIEGLNLAPVKPGRCELICLPLRVLDSDGAPARAIVRAV
jgi:arylformamidase